MCDVILFITIGIATTTILHLTIPQLFLSSRLFHPHRHRHHLHTYTSYCSCFLYLQGYLQHTVRTSRTESENAAMSRWEGQAATDQPK